MEQAYPPVSSRYIADEAILELRFRPAALKSIDGNFDVKFGQTGARLGFKCAEYINDVCTVFFDEEEVRLDITMVATYDEWNNVTYDAQRPHLCVTNPDSSHELVLSKWGVRASVADKDDAERCESSITISFADDYSEEAKAALALWGNSGDRPVQERAQTARSKPHSE